MATTQSQYEQYLAWKQAIDDAARSAEYTKNRPWDSGPGVVVADMFGNVNDNPDVRAARENEYDRNMAQARYDKLASNLRVDQERNAIIQRSGGTPFPITQTPESIQQDAFGGYNSAWGRGLQRPGTASEASRKTDLELEMDLYLRQVAAAQAATDPAERARLNDLANATKAAIEKRGRGSAPIIPTRSTTETVRTIPNPIFGQPGEPPTISVTNTSNRVSGPAPQPAPYAGLGNHWYEVPTRPGHSPMGPFDLGISRVLGGSAATPQRKPSFMFAGSEGGTNLFSGPGASSEPPPPPASGARLDKATAIEFLKQAGGNRAEAERLALAAGYSF